MRTKITNWHRDEQALTSDLYFESHPTDQIYLYSFIRLNSVLYFARAICATMIVIGLVFFSPVVVQAQAMGLMMASMPITTWNGPIMTESAFIQNTNLLGGMEGTKHYSNWSASAGLGPLHVQRMPPDVGGITRGVVLNRIILHNMLRDGRISTLERYGWTEESAKNFAINPEELPDHDELHNLRYEALLWRYDIDVQVIKGDLAQLDLLKGDTSDVWTASFWDAVKKFQRNHGLREDGVPGPRTQEAIKIAIRLKTASSESVWPSSQIKWLIKGNLRDPQHVSSQSYTILDSYKLKDEENRRIVLESKRGRLFEYVVSPEGHYVSHKEGNEAARQILTSTSDRINANSDTSKVFIHLVRNPQGGSNDLLLRIGDRSVKITKQDLAKLKRGESLPQIDPLFSPTDSPRHFIIWRDPFARAITYTVSNYGPSVQAPELVTLLQARYGIHHRFYLDDEMAYARTALDHLPDVKSWNDIALVDGRKYGIDDLGEMEGLRDYMESRIGQIVTPDRAGQENGESVAIEANNVIFVVGHKNKPFRDLVQKLADVGALEGKMLVFFSCYDGKKEAGEESDETFQSRLIRGKKGPAGVLFFNREIHPMAVTNVIKQLPNVLNENDEVMSMLKLLKKTIPQFLKSSDFLDRTKRLSPQAIEEFSTKHRELGNPVLQISENLTSPRRIRYAAV